MVVVSSSVFACQGCFAPVPGRFEVSDGAVRVCPSCGLHHRVRVRVRATGEGAEYEEAHVAETFYASLLDEVLGSEASGG